MADWRDALAEVSELAPSETLRRRVIRAADQPQQQPAASSPQRSVRLLRRGGVWLLGAAGVVAVLAALALAAHTRSNSSASAKPPAPRPTPSTVSSADVVVRVSQRNPPFKSLAVHVVCSGDNSSVAWPELCSAIERAPSLYTIARSRQGCWAPLAVVHMSVRGAVGGRPVHFTQSSACGPVGVLAWYHLLSNDPRLPSWLGTVGSASAPPSCDPSQLRLAPGSQAPGPAGSNPLVLELRNRGPRCSISGFPRVRVYDGSGRLVPLGIVYTNPPTSVVSRHGGSLFIGLDKRSCVGPDGDSVSTIQLRVPLDGKPLSLGLPASVHWAYCGPGAAGSKLDVSPFETTSDAARRG